jgi:hypothetical protein
LPVLAQSASADTPPFTPINSTCQAPINFTKKGTGPRQGPVTLVPILWNFPDNYPTTRWKQILDDVYSGLENSMYYGWLEMEYQAPVLNHVYPVNVFPQDVGYPLDDGTLKNDLGNLIASNAVPRPSNAVYVIHLPAGTTTDKVLGSTCNNTHGYNGNYLDPNPLLQYYFAVVPDMSTCSLGFPEMTRAIAHEVVENVTDPGYDGNIFDGTSDSSNGWVNTSTQGGKVCNQLADICDGQGVPIMTPKGSYTFQRLWSNAQQGCVSYDVQWHHPDHFVNPPNGNVFVPGGGVAAASYDVDNVETFAIGYDGKLWSTGFWYQGSWNDSAPLSQDGYTFKPGGGLAAIHRVSQHIDTFTIGNDGKLWSAGYYDWGTWYPAGPIVQAQNQFVFPVGGGITAASRTPYVLDTFAIGWDQHVWNTGWFDDNGWHPAYEPTTNNVTFVPGGGVAAVGEDANNIDVFTIGYDGNLWSAASWRTDHWVAAYPVLALNGLAAAGAQLGAVLRQPGNIVDVVFIAFNGSLWDLRGVFDTTNGFHWVAFSAQPTATTNVVFKPGGGVAAASRLVGGVNDLIDTVAIGYDSVPWTAGWLAP